jgi:hypothetical protein
VLRVGSMQRDEVNANVYLCACKTHFLDIVKDLLFDGQVYLDRGAALTLPLHIAIKTSEDDTAIIGAVLKFHGCG